MRLGLAEGLDVLVGREQLRRRRAHGDQLHRPRQALVLVLLDHRAGAVVGRRRARGRLLIGLGDAVDLGLAAHRVDLRDRVLGPPEPAQDRRRGRGLFARPVEQAQHQPRRADQERADEDADEADDDGPGGQPAARYGLRHR